MAEKAKEVGMKESTMLLIYGAIMVLVVIITILTT
jgi:hypothetical protein